MGMTRRTQQITIGAAALAALLIVSGCGDSGSVTAHGDSTPAAIDYPTSADHVVISHGRYTIAGDGRVYREATPDEVAVLAPADTADPTESPNPASGSDTSGRIRTLDVATPEPRPLMVAQLTPDGMHLILAEAERLDLLTEDTPAIDHYDYLPPTVTIDIGSGRVQHIAYQSDSTAPDDDAPARVTEFYEYLTALESNLGAEISDFEPYLPEYWRVDLAWEQWHDYDQWPGSEPLSEGACVPAPLETDATWDVYTGSYEDDGQLFHLWPALPGQCT